MAFVPLLRDDILKTLDNTILPVLASQRVLQLLAAPPFHLSGMEQQILREAPLPDPPHNPLLDVYHWNEAKMLASRGLHLTLVCDGLLHKKIGILESHQQQLGQRQSASLAGVQLVRLAAPASILYADFTARENDVFIDEKAARNTKTLTLHFDHEVTVTLSGYLDDERMCSHRLQLRDEALKQLATIYREEMRLGANTDAAQTLLLAIMNRLRYRLASLQSTPGKDCGEELEEQTKEGFSKTQQKHHQLCRNVIDYVQNNIHRPLNIKQIAHSFAVSEYHLSKVFHQQYGVTLIHYISAMRIDAAKTMLCTTQEPVSEVALRTGFSSAESFSHVFRKHAGTSPRQFRNQHKPQRQ